MSRYLSDIRQIVRQKLRDEPVSGVDEEWESDEIDIHIQQVLEEMSHYSPYEMKETKTTTADSWDISLSTITDLICVDAVEYPVAQDPKAMVAFGVWGTTLTMDGDSKPTAAETAYLYCRKLHTLTDSASTLNAVLEQLLIRGVCASLVAAKAREHINEVNAGGANVANQMYQWAIGELQLFRNDVKRMARVKQGHLLQFKRD